MTLAQKTRPKPSVAWGEASKTQPKIIIVFDTLQAAKGGGRRQWRHPASALDHDSLRPDFRPSGRGRPCRLPAARQEPAS